MTDTFPMDWFDCDDLPATMAFYDVAVVSGVPMGEWSDPEFMRIIRGSRGYEHRRLAYALRRLREDIKKSSRLARWILR
jgi:hypothetical protein